MMRITHTDQRMQRVRVMVPCEDDDRLLENRYELYTLRTFRLWGVPIWWKEIDVERRPIHKLINRACGGSTVVKPNRCYGCNRVEAAPGDTAPFYCGGCAEWDEHSMAGADDDDQDEGDGE